MKQTSLASLTYDAKKKQTRREKFLAEMEQAVPWEALLAVIDPFYPKAGRRGRQPMALSTMLRIYFMQQGSIRCRTLEWRMPCTRLNRCGALRVWNLWKMPFRTKRRSSISDVCWNGIN